MKTRDPQFFSFATFQVHLRIRASQRSGGIAGDPRQHYQRLCAPSQGRAQGVSDARPSSSSQSQVPKRLPSPVGLLRRSVPGEGPKPDAAGERKSLKSSVNRESLASCQRNELRLIRSAPSDECCLIS